jgi:hypothetical protein
MTFNVRLILAALLILWAPLSSADWINLTGAETAPNIAEIYVHDDHVKVKLEVYFGDLAKFEELVPDEWLKDSGSGSGSKRPSVEKRMQTFASERLQIITDKGVRLPAKLVLVEARNRVERLLPFAGIINPTTRQRVKKAPADKRVLYAEIIYSFPGKDKILKPKQLQIVPPLDAQGMVSANIGFVAFHQAVPIVDFRYLGQASTLNIDWQDPWYTRFENKNLSRHHKYPLMVYLYVEPRQVRLESLMRINDIADMTGFNAKDFLLNVKNKRQWLQEHIKNYYVDKDALLSDNQRVSSAIWDDANSDNVEGWIYNVNLIGISPADPNSTPTATLFYKLIDEGSITTSDPASSASVGQGSVKNTLKFKNTLSADGDGEAISQIQLRLNSTDDTQWFENLSHFEIDGIGKISLSEMDRSDLASTTVYKYNLGSDYSTANMVFVDKNDDTETNAHVVIQSNFDASNEGLCVELQVRTVDAQGAFTSVSADSEIAEGAIGDECTL